MSPRKFAVRVVTALPGGRFTAAGDIELDSKRACVAQAERMQTEFDEDCDPKRAYVIAPDGVPVQAAGVPEWHPRRML